MNRLLGGTRNNPVLWRRDRTDIRGCGFVGPACRPERVLLDVDRRAHRARRLRQFSIQEPHSNRPNVIIFVKLLDPEGVVFSKGTRKSSAVTRAEAELPECLRVVRNDVGAYYAKVVMASSGAIQRATLDHSPDLKPLLVVGRRRYLTHDQLEFMAGQNSAPRCLRDHVQRVAREIALRRAV